MLAVILKDYSDECNELLKKYDEIIVDRESDNCNIQ